jgi:hypothetical protein
MLNENFPKPNGPFLQKQVTGHNVGNDRGEGVLVNLDRSSLFKFNACIIDESSNDID